MDLADASPAQRGRSPPGGRLRGDRGPRRGRAGRGLPRPLPSGEDVAIKLLHARFTGDPTARRRFMREAEVARQVAIFCTARVLDMGAYDDRPYIVSEYVRGASLEEVVRAEGPRTGGSLARLAVTTATALAAIHRAGIVHRDFKPGNVIIGPEGPVVIDFGLSRPAELTATSTGTVGTPAYMAPEQFSGDPGGPAADVFSWAGTIVYAATGHRAFHGDTLPALLHAVATRDPDLSGVPGALRPILARCLAKDPASRPPITTVLDTLTAATPPPSTPPPRPRSRRAHPRSRPRPHRPPRARSP
ncbi:serine/threonine-protein kinase [Thermocatellispora tengchongensis]|uniref:serine/threonine-protein kinase n=1 Tax=Thermocatellispora tengchongensis TaxID=1073253 RepID=UPI003626FC7A